MDIQSGEPVTTETTVEPTDRGWYLSATCLGKEESVATDASV